LLLLAAIPYVQLFPLGDVQHLWWASPLGVVLTVTVIFRHQNFFVLKKFVQQVFILTMCVGLFSFLSFTSKPRVTLDDNSIFRGMQIQDEYIENYYYVSNILKSLPPNSVKVTCEDAAISVWNGKYLADSPNFVNWGWARDDEAVTSSRYLVSCMPSYFAGELLGLTPELEILSRPPRSVSGYFDAMQLSNKKTQFVFVYRYRL
jgi:hypothetical protein